MITIIIMSSSNYREPETISDRIKSLKKPAPPLSNRFVMTYAPVPLSKRHPKKSPLPLQPISNENQTENSRSSADEPTWFGLSKLLEEYPATSQAIEKMVTALQDLYPHVPGPIINYPDGPFAGSKPYQVFRTHLVPETRNFENAKENISLTGRVLDSEEEKYLRYILRSPLAWSATWKSHHNDAWVKHIQHRFPHIPHLRPILDDMTWPEEIHLFPHSYGPGGPGFMLFANVSFYYLYYFELDELLRVGETLEEVYFGLLDRRWSGMKGEKRFLHEPDNGEEYDTGNYFPEWEARHGGYKLASPLCEFVPLSG